MNSQYGSDLDNLVCDLVKDSGLEKAWIMTFSRAEFLAANHIRNNITPGTPQHEIEKIEEHAKEEDEHGELLKKAYEQLPATEPGSCYENVEERFKEISQSFMNAYFGNEMLTSLRCRHAAYVHGAMTIEKFPFQVYGAYIKRTNFLPIKEILPKIIEDEHDHLHLGQSLRKDLPKDKWISIKELDKLQMELGHLQVKRMHKLVREFKSAEDASFEMSLCNEETKLVAWLYTGLTNLKSDFPTLYSELSLQKLRRSILLKRRGFSQSKKYKELEVQTSQLWKKYLAEADEGVIKSQLVTHFDLISANSFDMGIAWALEKILKDLPEEAATQSQINHFTLLKEEVQKMMAGINIEVQLNEKWQ